MSAATPPAEVDIDEALVRSLLEEQHPDLADRPVRFFGEGWDNVMFRLGSDLSVRLPRRRIVADLIIHEQRWLPELADSLPLPVPAPVSVGRPSGSYPFPWSVLPWLPGEAADQAPPGTGQGVVLAEFLRALHQPAPADAPHNPGRGVPLADRATGVEERLDRLAPPLPPSIVTVWGDAISAPAGTDRTWVHGDLHAANVLVDDGAFSGVIDWIDINAGDAATDLAAMWTLLGDPDERHAALRRYHPGPDLERRARGWAVFFGTVLLDTGLVDNPRYQRLGTAILERLHHDTRH
ncbi:MAG: aminoglycoside phosphotransferase family protein [Acidimicrobiales bacterium]